MYGIFGDLWSCLKDTTNKSHTKAKTGNDQDNGNNKNIFKKKERIKRELPPGTIRKEFHFEGNVQNIGFRFEIQSHAKPLGITGYAKNNDDGTVTAQLQGSKKYIDKVITDLQNIDRIQIDSITSKEIPLDYYENDFYILY